MTGRRALGLGALAAALLAYSWKAESLWELPTRLDVAVVGVLVLPASTALIWLALPLARSPRRHPLALPAAAALVALVLWLLDLETPFNLAKLACFTLIGFALVWAFHELWWVTLIAALVPLVDVWSVAAGPTRHVIDDRPGLIENLAVGSAFPGEASVIYLGPPDVIFFALFLATAARYELRVGATWLGMTGLLGLTLAAVVLGDISGLPALPAVCLGFLIPNADLLWRNVKDARRAPEVVDDDETD